MWANADWLNYIQTSYVKRQLWQSDKFQQVLKTFANGMVWYGMVWYGMVWYGMVWYGMVWYEHRSYQLM